MLPSRPHKSMRPQTTSFHPPIPDHLEPSSAETLSGEEKTAVVSANSIITGTMPIVRISRLANQTCAHPETIESQITAYYYVAVTNVLCQAHVPHPRQVEDNDPVKALIDISYRDFQVLDGCGGVMGWPPTSSTRRIRTACDAQAGT